MLRNHTGSGFWTSCPEVVHQVEELFFVIFWCYHSYLSMLSQVYAYAFLAFCCSIDRFDGKCTYYLISTWWNVMFSLPLKVGISANRNGHQTVRKATCRVAKGLRLCELLLLFLLWSVELSPRAYSCLRSHAADWSIVRSEVAFSTHHLTWQIPPVAAGDN